MEVLFYFLFLKCFIIYVFGESNSFDCKSATTDIQKICLDQERCDTCLGAHVCCSWCYDETYSGRKCNVKNQLTGCNKEKTGIALEMGSVIIQNDKFTNINDHTDMKKIIQMKPQHIKVTLRKGVPLNVSFAYKLANNYPLELYYLGDLSKSMNSTIKAFRSLGKDLPHKLRNLTSKWNLAYGSFVDKPGMPFYFTDPESYNNPCHPEFSQCEKGYSFRHRLDFTNDTTKFLKKVESSQITANVDDLDGALDAILQILHCDHRIGFSEYSRKIILLATDSLLHSAGDGVLVGATLRPSDKCLLDKNGEYSQSLKYDYPSLETIELLLRQKKVNIIFAVKTQTKLYYYTNMTRDSLKEFAYVGELEEDSENIFDLIKSGYFSFVEQVSFSINQTASKNYENQENYDIKFFADCENNNKINETSTCYHVKNEPISFKLQITLKNIPLGKFDDTLLIEEKNLNEFIKLSVEYAEVCRCENDPKSNITCNNGVLSCGFCQCEEGWTGVDCSEKCEDYEVTECLLYNEDGIPSKICNENGECKCGKCICETSFTGNYCQYECPSKRRRRDLIVCGGHLKGKCHEGKCLCEAGYTGEDCTCSMSQHDCTFDGSNICSGKGECICNECKCNANFTGKYCETSKYEGTNTICEEYESIIKDGFQENGKKEILKNNRMIKIIDNFICGDNDKICTTAIFEGNSRCIFEYCYYQAEDNDNISLPARKNCTMSAGIKTMFLGGAILAAILLFGVLGIISWKLKMWKQEKAEYQRFMAENKNAVEMNPIYRSPFTEYINPLRTKSD